MIPLAATRKTREPPHQSATQLLAAGTDLNTVAGRLGQGKKAALPGTQQPHNYGKLETPVYWGITMTVIVRWTWGAAK